MRTHLCRRFCVEGLMATVFWGIMEAPVTVAMVTRGWAGAGDAVGIVTGDVMMA